MPISAICRPASTLARADAHGEGWQAAVPPETRRLAACQGARRRTSGRLLPAALLLCVCLPVAAALDDPAEEIDSILDMDIENLVGVKVTTASKVQESALDAPASGSEFQRADTAPRLTFGNGLLTVADWVQTGRYAAALDPIVSAGGPGTPVLSLALSHDEGPGESAARDGAGDRRVLLRSRLDRAMRQLEVTVEYEATGGENAIGFSLAFDPRALVFGEAMAGRDLAGGVVNVNSAGQARGELGFSLARPPGEGLAVGARQLLRLTFRLAPGRGALVPAVVFGDLPVRRELVSVRAETLPVVWLGPVATARRER